MKIFSHSSDRVCLCVRVCVKVKQSDGRHSPFCRHTLRMNNLFNELVACDCFCYCYCCCYRIRIRICTLVYSITNTNTRQYPQLCSFQYLCQCFCCGHVIKYFCFPFVSGRFVGVERLRFDSSFPPLFFFF